MSSIAVARRVQRALGDRATRPVLAAALLHDVGKVDADLGAYGRTVATLSGAAVKRDPETIRDWTRTRGFTRRVGLYLQHPRLGGDMLELAGIDGRTRGRGVVRQLLHAARQTSDSRQNRCR